MRTYRSYNIDINHPAVVAEAPAPNVSSRYTFIPTHQLVSSLSTNYWAFDGGTARRTRNPNRQSSTHHVLRFSNPRLPVLEDGTRPQAVILNSHGGGGCFELSLGAFRIACANGLVVQSLQCGTIKLRHVGLNISEILGATDELLSRAPDVFAHVQEWSRVGLSIERQRELAHRASLLRWSDGGTAVNLDEINRSRRPQDTGNDLWRTFNRVQESVLRGGITVSKLDSETGITTRRNASAIRNPVKSLTLNRDLWQIAEEFATVA